MTYCEICGWDVDSNGHRRECVRPKEEVDERDRVAKLESDLAAALLQIDDLKKQVAESEKDCEEAIEDRDAYEEKLAEVAHDAGCKEEWSNLHAHGDCITNEWDAKLQESNRLSGDLQKVVEGCRDTLAQFAGGPIIAHPPKCRFYIQMREKDCTCGAKNTMNDVLLSLKACREILTPEVKRKDECTCGHRGKGLHGIECPIRG